MLILFILLCLLALAAGAMGLKLYAIYREKRQSTEKERIQRADQLLVQLHDDLVVLKEVADGLKVLPGLVEGLTEMTKVASHQLDSFNKTVEILERSMASTDTSYEDYADDTPEGVARRERVEIRELMRHGIPESEAASRVRERDIYQDLAKNYRGRG